MHSDDSDERRRAHEVGIITTTLYLMNHYYDKLCTSHRELILSLLVISGLENFLVAIYLDLESFLSLWFG